MVRIDAHTNLGLFPSSSHKQSHPHETSIDEMIQYLTDNQITHHICLYPYDGYHMLEELYYRLPTVHHLGVQVLMGPDRERANDITKLEFDINRNDRPLCVGIKLASARGWWIRDNEVVSGLDYGQFFKEIRKYILDKLPDNVLCSFHTQGGYKFGTGVSPINIGNFAKHYPNLKFLINHAGDYGLPAFNCKPVKYKKYEQSVTYAYGCTLIQSARYFAENMHNIWLETSVASPHKANILNGCGKWVIGSDFPFGNGKITYTSERKVFSKYVTDFNINNNESNFLRWLDEDYETLIQRHIINGSYKDDINEVIDEIQ